MVIKIIKFYLYFIKYYVYDRKIGIIKSILHNKMKTLFLIAFTTIFCSCFQINQSPSHHLNAVYTVFTALYPQSNLTASSQIFLRGDNCNLNWNKGVSLKKTGLDTWSTSILCPVDTKISVKLLVNDTKWMMGANYVFTISASQSSPNITIYPSFNPSINKIVDSNLIHSTILNNNRKISVYYPPSFYDNKHKKY